MGPQEGLLSAGFNYKEQQNSFFLQSVPQSASNTSDGPGLCCIVKTRHAVEGFYVTIEKNGKLN